MRLQPIFNLFFFFLFLPLWTILIALGSRGLQTSSFYKQRNWSGHFLNPLREMTHLRQQNGGIKYNQGCSSEFWFWLSWVMLFTLLQLATHVSPLSLFLSVQTLSCQKRSVCTDPGTVGLQSQARSLCAGVITNITVTITFQAYHTLFVLINPARELYSSRFCLTYRNMTLLQKKIVN